MSDTMWALTFDAAREDWATSTGLVKERVPVPHLTDPAGAHAQSALVRVKYAGFCGSDRGIWWRKAFGDLILGSLAEEGRTKRVVGHEMLGEIVEAGHEVAAAFDLHVGDVVSTESHIICGTCYQCQRGETHVCTREKIIGISRDGCFAEYIQLPAKALWKTDLGAIRPEVGAMQEPFGNAVHACQVTELRDRTVAIVGCGTIGLFAIMIAKGMGARKVIGVEVEPRNAALALKLGADVVLAPKAQGQPHQSDPSLRDTILDLTDGVGADVSLEMAGFNNALNNAVKITRRGGHVVLFGVKNGDVTVEDYHRIVMSGLTLHAVVGRRIFQTWEITKRLLEDRSNGIQAAMYETILNGGVGTISDIETWTPAGFEALMAAHPKGLIRFAG